MTTSDPNTTQPTELPLPHKALRVLLFIAAAAVALSTLPWIFFSVTGKFGAFEWSMLGYELITLLGAFYAFRFAAGKDQNGWALGVTAIAGSWLVALVFGFYVAFIKSKRADFPELLTLSDVTLLTRAAAIAFAAIIASLAVFTRRAKSFKYAIGSLVWASPIIIAATLVALDTSPGKWLSGLFTENPNASGGKSAVALLAVGFVAIALISVSGHLLIRAFELGAIDRDEQPSDA